jgi:hypothetical protein
LQLIDNCFYCFFFFFFFFLCHSQVLNNQETRLLYNKFGESGLHKAIDGNEVLLEIAVTYVTWGMLVFVLTLGKGSGSARNWIYSGQIAMLIVEVSLTLQDVTLPDWFLPTTTECEVIWLMHAIFPAFMNGCRVIGSFYYVDVEELTKNTLLSLRDSHKVSSPPLNTPPLAPLLCKALI